MAEEGGVKGGRMSINIDGRRVPTTPEGARAASTRAARVKHDEALKGSEPIGSESRAAE